MDTRFVIYTSKGLLSILEKKKIPSFTTASMRLQDIMLSEINQKKKDHVYEEFKSFQLRTRGKNGGCHGVRRKRKMRKY